MRRAALRALVGGATLFLVSIVPAGLGRVDSLGWTLLGALGVCWAAVGAMALGSGEV